MLSGVLAALGAGLLWGLVFVVPLMLHDYPAVQLAAGRYLAFGLLCLGLAALDRRALAQLERSDWIEAAKLALVGNLIYYSALASAIQLAGAPLPTLMIGSLPVVIALTANLLDARSGAARALPWHTLALPLAAMAGGLALVHAAPGEMIAASSGGYALGVALAALAVASWTWYPIRNSRWLQARPPGLSRAWATAQGLMTLPLAALALLALWLLDLARPSGAAFDWPLGPQPGLYLALMVITGLAASWLGTLLWNHASHVLPAALAGQLIVFETLAALGYAFLWYRRWPTAAELGGMALLVAGVLLGVRAFRPARSG